MEVVLVVARGQSEDQLKAQQVAWRIVRPVQAWATAMHAWTQHETRASECLLDMHVS
jgi:hypothetical protein